MKFRPATSLKRLLFVLAMIVCLLVALLLADTLYPGLLDKRFGYKEVFRSELPDGVKCLGQNFFSGGRDSTGYYYHVALQDDAPKLLDLVERLGLKEVDISVYSGYRLMNWNDAKWWNPPSQSMEKGYQLFKKESGELHSTEYCFIQAELIGDKLYLMKAADYKTLNDPSQSLLHRLLFTL